MNIPAKLGENFSHCATPQKVYEELSNHADMASSEDELIFLEKHAIARIKELKSCQG